MAIKYLIALMNYVNGEIVLPFWINCLNLSWSWGEWEIHQRQRKPVSAKENLIAPI